VPGRDGQAHHFEDPTMPVNPIALRQPTEGTDRFDLYAQVHKGLRAFMCDTLVSFGGMDADDNQQAKECLDQLGELLDFCAGHIDKENHFVQAALEARHPGTTLRLAEEHVSHTASMEQLRSRAHFFACASSSSSRRRAAGQLYRALATFVAENLAHMELEEAQCNASLWAAFSDSELVEMHGQLVAATSPAHMVLSARWIVPNLSSVEREALLAGVRPSMPAPAFNGLLDLIRPQLSLPEQQRLGSVLALPAWLTPAPGRAEDCARQFIDAAFVRFDAEAAAALVSADFISHPWAALGIPPGPAGLAPVVGAFRSAFSGVRVTLNDVLVDADRVAVRYLYEGRHSGDLFGIAATGRRFQLAGIAIMRVAGDKVAEYWREEDMLGLQRQLGVASLLAEATS
jgi:predicted ester cyclase